MNFHLKQKKSLTQEEADVFGATVISPIRILKMPNVSLLTGRYMNEFQFRYGLTLTGFTELTSHLILRNQSN